MDGDVSATYKGRGFHLSVPFKLSYSSSAAELCSSLLVIYQFKINSPGCSLGWIKLVHQL